MRKSKNFSVIEHLVARIDSLFFSKKNRRKKEKKYKEIYNETRLSVRSSCSTRA